MDKGNVLANDASIGNDVRISPDARIACDRLVIGKGTVITGKTVIACKECVIGKNNFFSDVWIEGSLTAGDTKITIGSEGLYLQGARLNCNDGLKIGDDVNVGQQVSVWTHASSMDVFNGYPFTKAPVAIGSHVWITAGTTVLPGVRIGSHVVIGNGSLVNRDIPGGCFAAGSPVRIIKENIYPKKLGIAEKRAIILDAIEEYRTLLALKPFRADVKMLRGAKVSFSSGGNETVFDCDKRKITGELDEFSEDFRDFLRYRGIKFFTDQPFASVPPKWYSELKKKEKRGK